MIRQHRTLAQGCAVLVTAAFLATGCSSSSSSGSTGGAAATTTTTTTAAATSSAGGSGGGSQPTDVAGATQAIKDMWVKYFDSTIDMTTKTDIIQNPTKMAPLLTKLQAAGAAGASSTVNSVTFSSPTFAKVDFAILLGGKVVLPSASGQAILDPASGKWQVADTTLCQLATLDGIDKATTTAAGCP